MPKRGQKRRPFFQKIRGIKSLRGFFHRHWEWEQWNRKILSSKPGIFGLVDWGSPGYIHVQPGAHSISIEEVSTTLLTLSTCPSSKKKCIYIYTNTYIFHLILHPLHSPLNSPRLKIYNMKRDSWNMTCWIPQEQKTSKKAVPTPKKRTKGMKFLTVWPWFLDWSLSKGFPSCPTENCVCSWFRSTTLPTQDANLHH